MLKRSAVELREAAAHFDRAAALHPAPAVKAHLARRAGEALMPIERIIDDLQKKLAAWIAAQSAGASAQGPEGPPGGLTLETPAPRLANTSSRAE